MIEGMKNRGINIERINYQDNEKIKEIEIYKNLQIYMWAVSKKLIKPWVNYETLETYEAQGYFCITIV